MGAGNTIINKAIPPDAIGSKSLSRITAGKKFLVGVPRRFQLSNGKPCCEDGCSACEEVVVLEKEHRPFLLPWEMHQVMKELKSETG